MISLAKWYISMLHQSLSYRISILNLNIDYSFDNFNIYIRHWRKSGDEKMTWYKILFQISLNEDEFWRLKFCLLNECLLRKNCSLAKKPIYLQVGLNSLPPSGRKQKIEQNCLPPPTSFMREAEKVSQIHFLLLRLFSNKNSWYVRRAIA